MTGCSRYSRTRQLLAAAAGVLVMAAPGGPAFAQPPEQPRPPAPYQAHEQLAPLGASQAWRLSTGEGVVVAVLDSGIDAGHPDLAGRVLPGADYVDGSTDGRRDLVGHGTTVASLIAGSGEPAVGMAPGATILPVRVLDEENRYEQAATIAQGVVWAVDNGADVINLSLGGPGESDALADAVAYALAHDVVVIACTGNQNSEDAYPDVWYPAREPGVVAVTGLDLASGTPESWPVSLTGPEAVIAAPAIVTGAQVGGGHREVQGTSFSSALVAGTAALMRAHWPQMSAADVVHRLITTADDLGEPGRDPDFGFGALDPVGALTEEVPSVPTNPLDTKARQGVAGFGAAPDHRWQLTAPSAPGPEGPGRAARPGGDSVTGPDATDTVHRGQPSDRAAGPGPWLLTGVLVLLGAAGCYLLLTGRPAGRAG